MICNSKLIIHDQSDMGNVHIACLQSFHSVLNFLLHDDTGPAPTSIKYLSITLDYHLFMCTMSAHRLLTKIIDVYN